MKALPVVAMMQKNTRTAVFLVLVPSLVLWGTFTSIKTHMEVILGIINRVNGELLLTQKENIWELALNFLYHWEGLGHDPGDAAWQQSLTAEPTSSSGSSTQHFWQIWAPYPGPCPYHAPLTRGKCLDLIWDIFWLQKRFFYSIRLVSPVFLCTGNKCAIL